MPIMKIGQASHNDVSKLQQEHFDADSKIWELLNIMSLDVKRKLAVRIPSIVDEINAELRASETDINS